MVAQIQDRSRNVFVGPAQELEWYQQTRFGEHASARCNLITRLQRHDSPASNRLASRLSDCCSAPVVTVHGNDDEIRIREKRCKCRLCPLCRKERARACFLRTLAIVHKLDSARFLTLTLQHSKTPLVDQIRRLKDAFTALRRTVEFRRHVVGGVYTIEVKWNEATETWHPHLHAIIDGTFWRQSAISDLWYSITKDTFRVDIRQCYSDSQLTSYITSYVSKSDDVRRFPTAQIVEWAEAVAGMRLIQTFGSCHGLAADEDEPMTDERDRIVRNIADPAPIAALAKLGDVEARQIMDELQALDGRRVSDASAAAAGPLRERIYTLVERIRAFHICHPDTYSDPHPPPPKPPPTPQPRLIEEPEGVRH